MLLSVMLTVSFILVDCKIRKRHVSNSIEPQKVEEVYDLSGWISSLHLQQCVFIAIGENFFAIFLEKVPRPFDEDQEIKDYFIGICDLDNLAKWKLCPVPVELKRPEDCKFDKNTQQSARVHRRLCDLSELTSFASQCNCGALLRSEKLYNVVGFPTCFRPHMETSLCGYNNVCGLNSCKLSTVANRIYAVKCDENCFGHKPFCESPEWRSSKQREISSFWSDWSESECNSVDCLAMSSEAKCINKETGVGDVDCLGPGTSCCPKGLENCKCHVFIEEGMSKLMRTYSVHPAPEYEDISLEEIIKNLPLKNEHRQFKPKLRRRHRLAARQAKSDSSDVCVHKGLINKAKTNLIRMIDDDEDDEDDNDDIKSIERDEEENGEDDIMIEEGEITTKCFKPLCDEDLDETKSVIHAFREAHKNDTIIDIPDRNNSISSSFGIIFSNDRLFIALHTPYFLLINIRNILILGT